MPPELAYCKEIQESQELVHVLSIKPINDLVIFFTCGCEDGTWIKQGGGSLLNELMEILNTRYLKNALVPPLAQEIVKTIQIHYDQVNAYLHEDLNIRLKNDNGAVRASSLILGTASPFFARLIRKEIIEKKGWVIDLNQLPKSLFLKVKTFYYTGTIEDLWREEPEEILSLILQATNWEMDSLARFATTIFKRYIQEDNVIFLLLRGLKEPLPTLSETCIYYIEDHITSLSMQMEKEGNLKVIVKKPDEVGLELVSQLAEFIEEIGLEESAARSETLISFLSKLPRLEVLDLHETFEVPVSVLVQHFPSVSRLNLEHCDWVDDDFFVKIISKLYKINDLNLAGNSQLTFRTWGALIELRGLNTLNVSRCRNLSDDDLDLLAASCPSIRSLNLSGNKNIGDIGLMSLTQCSQLKVLTLSFCVGISPGGLVEFAQWGPKLDSLNLQRCPAATDHSVLQLIRLQPQLRHLNLLGNQLAKSTIHEIKRIMTDLELKVS
ncbi:MAG: hypothetical protein Tsb0021_00160 [Chlamydiales bacterium]